MYKNLIFVIYLILFFDVSDSCFAQTNFERENDSKKLHDRYWQILVNSPRRGTTFDRVYNLYSQSNEINQLLDKCLKISKQSPNDAKSWILLGLIYEKYNNPNKAIESYKLAANLAPKEPLAFYYLGESLISQGKLHEAINMLEISIQNNPSNKQELRSILLLLGKTTERAGYTKKADNVWKQLQQLYPNNPEIVSIITNILESERRIDEAIKIYDQYLISNPNNYSFVQFKLASLSLKIRKDKNFSPVNDYENLLDKLDPNSWLAEIVRKRLEQFFAEKNNLAGLADFYKNRLKKYPNESESILKLANLLIKLERKNESQELLENTIAKSPNNTLLRHALIDIYVTKNQLDAAIEQYQKIDKIKSSADPNYIIEWGELIMKSTQTNKRDEAIKIWSRLVDQSPDNPIIAIRVAELAEKYNITDTAEKYYKYAITLRPDDAVFREYLGIFYYRQAEIKKAVEIIQSIAENNRKNAESLTLVGTLLSSIHAEKESLDAFKNAVKLSPENPSIRWKYIESLTRQGDADNAVTQLVETDKLIQSDDEFDAFLRNEIRFMTQISQSEKILKKLNDKITDNNSGIIVTKNQTQKLYWRIAVYNRHLGKSETAIQMMDKAIEYQNNIVENNSQTTKLLSLRILQAATELYAKCNDTNKAIKILQILSEQNSIRQTTFIRQLAELQIEIGDKDTAIKTINRLIESGVTNAAVIASCAELLFKSEKIQEAIDLLRRGLRLNPNDLLIQKMLSEYLAKNGQIKDAIDVARRLFDKTENIESKMQLAKTIAEYYLAIEISNKVEKVDVNSKNKSKLNDKTLSELLYIVKNSADRRSSVLCAAAAFEVLSDFAAAREELEGFLIETGGENHADKLLLRKLVNVTQKLHDYESAVKYQEIICKDNNDSAELDKLFALYDINGNREKQLQLFMRQILNKNNLQEQLNMIDKMICREEYDAVDHVLAFFEIHEESNWEITYRQIAIAAYKKQKNLPELVRNFRKQNFVDNKNSNDLKNENNYRNEYSTGDQFTKYLDDQFNNSAWKLNANLPTKDFSVWKIENDDPETTSIFKHQEIFLLTLFREKLIRNQNYRTFNNVPPPKPFYRVDNFSEASFLSLCWMLREMNVEEIIKKYNPTEKEIKRLKALCILQP
ncbi:MAG: tetratricopeptide repeat protein [Planctomycetaceae bacterium]|jgi:tetratricopeptide (TPR) repeat protein|nr:tetratricopeptide repeat protein [Planctomycetaceae bacterium]